MHKAFIKCLPFGKGRQRGLPAGEGQDAHDLRAVAIESIDDDYIGFRTREGEKSLLPSERVRGVTVKDRDRGGLIGAGRGTLAGAGLIAGDWLLAGGGVGFDRCFLYCDAKALGGVIARA